MLVYISGPMSGYEDSNRPAFDEAAAFLRSLGFDVVNPVELDDASRGDMEYDMEYEEYLARDLFVLNGCDAIYMLPDWECSSGARLERAYAKELGLIVIQKGGEHAVLAIGL